MWNLRSLLWEMLHALANCCSQSDRGTRVVCGLLDLGAVRGGDLHTRAESSQVTDCTVTACGLSDCKCNIY